MGYDWFCLLTLDKYVRDVDTLNKKLKNMKHILNDYSENNYGDVLFGGVNNGPTTITDKECFKMAIQQVAEYLYDEFNDTKFLVYVSEFDGESLTIIEIMNGNYEMYETKTKKSITYNNKVVKIDMCDNIDSLIVPNNITILVNKKYGYGYCK